MAAKDVTGIECRHVVYCKPNYALNQTDDYHLIKELIHYEDGTTRPNLRFVKNYQRDYYIVKKGQRTFKDKKEYIELDKTIQYKTSQSKLIENIAKSLDQPYFRGGLRKLCRSPYVYGADIDSTAIIKKAYQDRYPDLNTYYNVAVFDTETDMINGTGEIIMATLSFKDRVYTVVKDTFIGARSDATSRLNGLLTKYLGNYVVERKIKWEVKIVPNESDIVVECIKKAHEWKPDILAIWNIDFDIPKCINALNNAGIDSKDIFSDPSIPREYRSFNYAQGRAIKVTATGKETPKNNYEQWHTVYCPSSFYIMDAMCLYYQIRSQGGKEQSYSLNSILDKHLGIRKLNFQEAEHLVKAEWHAFMQSEYPLEYIIYNVFDCVGMEILDEKILDMAITLHMSSGCSDFKNFASQPTRLADNFHWYCLEQGYVYGTTSDEMVNELDALTTGGKGWIVTLSAAVVVDNGLCVVEEDPLLRTNIRAFVGD